MTTNNIFLQAPHQTPGQRETPKHKEWIVAIEKKLLKLGVLALTCIAATEIIANLTGLFTLTIFTVTMYGALTAIAGFMLYLGLEMTAVIFRYNAFFKQFTFLRTPANFFLNKVNYLNFLIFVQFAVVGLLMVIVHFMQFPML